MDQELLRQSLIKSFNNSINNIFFELYTHSRNFNFRVAESMWHYFLKNNTMASQILNIQDDDPLSEISIRDQMNWNNFYLELEPIFMRLVNNKRNGLIIFSSNINEEIFCIQRLGTIIYTIDTKYDMTDVVEKICHQYSISGNIFMISFADENITIDPSKSVYTLFE